MEEKDFLVEKVGKCVVITMDLGENRINANFIRAMHKALDAAERYEDATCLVTTGVGKHYSLGLDLEWLAGLPMLELTRFTNGMQKLLARVLTFPMVTVAALNGHTYAGGAFLAVAHDHMIMRNQKGWFCFPEVNLKMLIPAGLMNLVKARLPQVEQHQAIVLGRRYTAEEALEGKIVGEVCRVEELRERAIQAGLRLAGKEGLSRDVLSAIKHDMYRDTFISLMEPIRYYSHL